MRQSRHVWLLGISLFCLVTLVVFKTPQAVISTLADPQYGSSPQSTIQQFWKLMDLRQTNLASDLVNLEQGSADESEFESWVSILNNDPMLSLQKVEFMNSDLEGSQGIIVRVSWTSSVQKVKPVVFSMSLTPSANGWRIQEIKRMNDLSFMGGNHDEWSSPI